MKYVNIGIYFIGAILAAMNIAPRLAGKGFITTEEVILILILAGVGHLLFGGAKPADPTEGKQP